MSKWRRKRKSVQSDEQTFSRRVLFLGSVQALLGLSLVGRLVYLGCFKGSSYKSLSDDNRIKVQFLLPKRGLITDRVGRIIADNQQAYRLTLIPDQCENVKDTLTHIAKHYPLDPEDIDQMVENIRYKPKFIPTIIAEGLTFAQVARLEVVLRDYPGCCIEQGWSRFYPYGFATAHLIGYVQTPSRDDQNNNALFRMADFRLGKSGIEKYYDDHLRGQVGYLRIEVNSKSQMVKELAVQESVPGSETTLSIDLELQKFVQDRLSEHKSGSCVVMDIHTGELLSLVSAPSFDANLFTNGIRSKDWKELNENPYGILHNKAIHGTYPPGSLFKMIVALAALESGLVTTHHRSNCRGYVEIGNHRFHCWHKHGGHGATDVVKALYQSCDIYFYEVAQTIGVERIRDMAFKLGLGDLTGIELPLEKKGLISGPQWKLTTHKQKWSRGDTLNMSIGQGALLTTPLQLAVMMARLANPHGVAVRPTVMKIDAPAFTSLGLQEKYLKLIREGLDRTVNDVNGLAFQNRIRQTGYEMGGKTATCQVRRISMAERKRGVLRNEQRPWVHRDHALFAGYAPIHEPRYAVAVVVEHGGAGGSVAAPIGRDVLLATQRLLEGKSALPEPTPIPNPTSTPNPTPLSTDAPNTPALLPSQDSPDQEDTHDSEVS